MTQPAQLDEVEALRQAQIKEYGQFLAKDTIYVGNARAYNAGDAVPVSALDSGAVSRDAVVGASTKAAAAITEKG